MEKRSDTVSSAAFYDEYHGHRKEHLELVCSQLRRMHSSLVFLAGDSSLDNKVWFPDEARAVNGYEQILDPPQSKMDIAYWMNHIMEQKDLRGKMATINCAVEESTIGSRACRRMWPQDEFIRDHIQNEDVLVISVGRNDVALRPTPGTGISIASLLLCASTSCLQYCSCGCAIPCEDYMACGFLSNFCAFPFGMGYMVHLFGVRIESLVKRLIANKKPKLVLVCMIYFLDEKPGNSWAENVLGVLGYNSNPGKLQEAIRQIFRLATQQIKIPGTEVIAVPLFKMLDGKDTTDYCQRVEPSAKGGQKMGAFLVDTIIGGLEKLDP
jgi:hypothetical protein